MSDAFTSWQERPERLLFPHDRKNNGNAAEDSFGAHSTAQWIQEQKRTASSPSRTDELDQYGIPIHPSQYSALRAAPAATTKADAVLDRSTSLAPSSAFRSSSSSRHFRGSTATQNAESVDARTSPSSTLHAMSVDPSPSASRIAAQPDDADEDESIGLLLGQSKRRRGRKDSYSSFGSSVLPVPLFASTARYNVHAGSNSGLAQSRQGLPTKQGRSTYPPSNHSGAAPPSRHLVTSSADAYANQHTQTDNLNLRQRNQNNALSSSRPSGFDLDNWLRASQAPSALRTSPSLGALATFDLSDRINRAGALSEAGTRRRRHHGGSASGLSAGVLSAGPESPCSRRKASVTSSRRDLSGYSSLSSDHPALMASLELNKEAESRTIDTIEEWRAKSGSPSALNASGTQSTLAPDRDTSGVQPSDIAPRRRRKSSVKSSSRPVSTDGPPPALPPIPSNFATESVTSRTGRRRRKDTETAVAGLLSPVRAVSSHRWPTAAPATMSNLTPAVRDLYVLSGLHSQAETPVRRLIRWLAKEQLNTTILPLVLMTSFLIRWVVARGDWSGRGAEPMHGDFEAQRHWIELTLHLPTTKWYFYDLQYWGLDYPPLTAWVSLAYGYASRLFPPVTAGFDFESSRGNEDEATATFMRATVIVGDLLFYLPAIALFLGRKLEGRGRRTQAIALFSIMLQPALILIDHGHFQYNSIMLGFATACFALLHTSLPHPGAATSSRPAARVRSQAVADLSRRLSYEYIAAAVFFCLSLSFKQMALYYAPAVFAIMLGRCIGLAHVDPERGLTLFIGLGLAVIITFGVVFAPWLTSLEQIGQIVHRIFPLARGLFEDKVANVWCLFSVLPLPARFKLKNVMAASALARLSLVVTLIAILPGCCLLFWAAGQTAKMETMVAQESVQTTQMEKAPPGMMSSATGSVKEISGAASHRSGTARSRRSTSVVGSAAGAPARSEIESLLAGSVSKSHSGRISHIGPIQESFALSHDSDYPRAMSGADARPVASTLPSPAAQMLVYGLVNVSSAFFLFGFQTHEKSILLPLLPMTLLLGAKGDTWGGQITAARDWEWSVWFNNMATFSLFPLLKKDGQSLQYVVLTLGWNWLIGNLGVPFKPLASVKIATSKTTSFFRRLSILTYTAALGLLVIELILPRCMPSLQARVWSRYPDIYPVLNVLLTAPCFVVIYVWALVRQVQVAFANGWEISLFTTGKKSSQKRVKTS